MKKLFLVIGLFWTFFAQSQTILTTKIPEYRYENKLSVGIHNSTALPTDVDFAVGDSAGTKGMFIPRVQTTAAIASPRQGMLVYSISDSSVYYRSLYGWRKMAFTNVSGAVDGYYIRYVNPPGQFEVSAGPTASNAIEKNGDDFRLGNVSPTGSALTRNAYIYGNSLYGVRFNNARFAQDVGASVTAENSMTLGGDGNIFTISGTTQINGIDTTGWQSGSIIHLFFSGYLTVKDSTTAGTNCAKINLDGTNDFVIQPGDYLGLMYNGSAWVEIGRRSRKSLNGYNIYNKDSSFTSNRTASLNGKWFKLYDGSNANFLIDPVEHQYFFGQQESQIYNHINMRDSVVTVNAGNQITEAHVTLTLDALNNQTELDVNGTGGFKHQSSGRVTTIGDVQNTGNKTKIIVDDDNSKIKITKMPSGASTDSMVVWNPGDSTLKKRPQLDTTAKWINTITYIQGTVKDSIRFNIGGIWYTIAAGYHTGSSNLRSKSAFAPFPSATDTIPLFVAEVNFTISSIKTVCTGGSSSSVTFQIYHGADRSSGTAILSGAATTSSTTTVETDTSFSSASISAGEQIWVVITSGAGAGINFNIIYSED